MSFYARMQSPLGELLLCASTQHLSGVYFTGQKDCPVLEGLPAPLPEAADPTIGFHDGVALKSLKISQQLGIPYPLQPKAQDPSFESDAIPLSYMQADTPAAACRILTQTQDQLREYFVGKRTRFTLPLQLQGTAFQQKIWNTLLDIPYGKYLAYGELADIAGLSTRHGRPVGTAVGRNPISIIVPCHRVLSASYTLNGYTGGLHRKLALLALEGAAWHRSYAGTIAQGHSAASVA